MYSYTSTFINFSEMQHIWRNKPIHLPRYYSLTHSLTRSLSLTLLFPQRHHFHLSYLFLWTSTRTHMWRLLYFSLSPLVLFGWWWMREENYTQTKSCSQFIKHSKHYTIFLERRKDEQKEHSKMITCSGQASYFSSLLHLRRWKDENSN